jgi:hypothetical protein
VTEYSTRVVVANDRYVCLQLPLDWPEGEASIIVSFLPATPVEAAETKPEVPLEATAWTAQEDPERDEVAWWEEG